MIVGLSLIIGVVMVVAWLRRALLTHATQAETKRLKRLIKRPRYRFTGHDESLERRSRERRAQAERLRHEARQLEARTDGRSKIHLAS